MTHPLTPREKVAAAMIATGVNIGSSTWPDEIQVDALTLADAGIFSLASGSGDHAELAGECVRGLQSIEDRICASDPYRFTDGTIYARSIRVIEALLAENAALRAERDGMVEEVSRSQARLHAATEAERKLAEAVGLLRGVDGGAATEDWWRVKVRTFLGGSR